MATRKGRPLYTKKNKRPAAATVEALDEDGHVVARTPEEKLAAKADKRERLQKIIAAAGICSRRKAEELILLGAVQVNGETVTELGAKADPSVDSISVEGKMLDTEKVAPVYFLLNKPRGYVSTTSDPQGRPTVMDLMRGISQRIYPVGRLDYASEGLLLFTNDGEMANKLMHPSFQVKRTYAVKVKGHVLDETLAQMRQGIHLADGFIKPVRVWRGESLGEKEWIFITVREGRNLEIRRVFLALSLDIDRLRRIGIGPLRIEQVPVGKYIPLRKEHMQAVLEDAAKK